MTNETTIETEYSVDEQIDAVIDRIDIVLHRHKKTFWLIVCMAVAIFIVSLSLLVIGLLKNDTAIVGSSAVIGFIYGSMRWILRLRREDIYLAVAPLLVKGLPPARAANEIEKLLERLRSN